MSKKQFKLVIMSVFTTFLCALSSCQESTGTANHAKVDENSGNITPYMSVISAFSCKPSQHTFIAAHRGTHKGSKYPENTTESLKALYAKGIVFAEIDIARLGDGTLILHHDGTWNRSSTGKGPVSTTNWRQAQKLLLRDTNGNITAFRPTRFRDVLKWAKGKMYLEIDFKSSVSEAKVVELIKSADMLEQVILISYSKAQALRLHKLAPKAMISVKILKPGDIKALEVSGLPTKFMAAWTARGPLSKNLATALHKKNIPILGSGRRADYQKASIFPDLMVTDYAFDVAQAFVIKGENMVEFEKCIAKQSRGS